MVTFIECKGCKTDKFYMHITDRSNDMRDRRNGKFTLVCVILLFVFLGVAAWIENVSFEAYEADAFQLRAEYSLQKELSNNVFPLFRYTEEGMWAKENGLSADLFCEAMPFFSYIRNEASLEGSKEDAETLKKLMALQEEAKVHETVQDEGALVPPLYYDEMLNENHHAVLFTSDSDFFTGGCGFVSELSTIWATQFQKATQKSVEYDTVSLCDYEYVMEHFYIVDPSTSAGPNLIKPQEFMEYDATIDKAKPGPHILIYHTHSQEAFADSVAGDKSTTIVGVGEKLSKLLREEYGYEVYHHTGEYDLNIRDDAYAKSAPALEEILKQYPQIQVIIDLHRDGVDESRHLVAEWEGREVAQFMFFNGLSFLNSKGKIDYLPNPGLHANLALSFQATVISNEYYPGLARRTYLNGYRYNMHYREKTMLIELGAQTNTVNEVMNACEPLAHVLDMVFSGERDF